MTTNTMRSKISSMLINLLSIHYPIAMANVADIHAYSFKFNLTSGLDIDFIVR